MKKSVSRSSRCISSDVTLVLLTPLNDKSSLVIRLALDGLFREDPSGSHDFLIWVSLHDVVQLLFRQELRDSELVPLVPFANHRSVHTFLLRFHECVVLYFLVRKLDEWGGHLHIQNFHRIWRLSTGLQHSGPDETSWDNIKCQCLSWLMIDQGNLRKSKPTKSQKTNKKETTIERGNPCDSEIPEWLQEFRENLVDDEIPLQGGSHASSSHEVSLEPTTKRREDLGKHNVHTHFP